MKPYDEWDLVDLGFAVTAVVAVAIVIATMALGGLIVWLL